MATASLSVEEVIDEVLQDSGEENVCESERENQRERVLLDPSFDAIVFLKTKPIYPRQLLIVESLIWLAAFRCRLCGRRRIRQPFTSKIYIDMPLEIFSLLTTVVDKLGFNRASCEVERNSKAIVIAFSDLAATIRFLSTLSAVTAEELTERYLRKSLAGRKSGSKVAVVVSEQKQFSFTLSIKRGQMDIFFILVSGTAMAFHNIIDMT